MWNKDFTKYLNMYLTGELSRHLAEAMLLESLTPQNVDQAMRELLPVEIRDEFLSLAARLVLADERYNPLELTAAHADFHPGMHSVGTWLMMNPGWHEMARDIATQHYLEWKRVDEAERNASQTPKELIQSEDSFLDEELDLDC